MTLDGGLRVPLVKSDGSTLYLSRDVTAALDRWATYRFDKMLYIVDSSQSQHFVNLKNILRSLDYDWTDGVEHVRFGRIQGMSTRKAKVVFLHDILDEAKLRMIEKQHESPSKFNIDKFFLLSLGRIFYFLPHKHKTVLFVWMW